MSMKSIFVAGTALVMSATLSAQAQKPQPAPRVTKEKPAQSQQLEWLPKDFNRLGFDFFSFGTPLQGKVVKGMPYSAEITSETIQTLSDGNRIVHRSTSRVYRDAEGRVRREDDRSNGSPSITISDPVANKSYTLDPANRTAHETQCLRFFIGNFGNFEGMRWTYGYTPLWLADVEVGRGGRSGSATASASGTLGDYTIALGRARDRGVRDRDEYVEEPLPNRTIEGVVASGIRRTTTIPQGAIGNEQPIKTVSEEWTSVDLQVLVLTDVNDPRNGRSTYRLTNINRANPDPALFKVPADYTLLTGRGRGGK